MSDHAPGNGLAEFEAALDRFADRMTPAERSIAAYLRENKATIAYETGAKMAESIGVSEMTIIRFVRGLGYKNVRDMKNRIRPRSNDAEALDDVRERFTSQTSDIGQLAESLQLELQAIQRAYEMASHTKWSRIVKTVATRQNVHVVGFQATRGLAVDFANRLKYVRPGVRYAEGSAGVYSEILESAPSKSVLVQVDTASYARKGILLARKARELNIPLIIVTDRYSHWAREFTEDLIEMNTYVGTFWDSTASISVVLNLLIHSVAARLGDKAKARFNWMVGLGEHFSEFDAAASRHVEAARKKPRKSE